jgi:hypothetical protein
MGNSWHHRNMVWRERWLPQAKAGVLFSEEEKTVIARQTQTVDDSRTVGQMVLPGL